MQIKTLLAATVLSAVPALSQQGCLFFNNAPPGTDLQLGDDQTVVLPLPFQFPFNNGLVDRIGICSNGYVWLTDNTTADFSDSETEFLSQDPRIAVVWDDLNPSAGGNVYYNTNGAQVSSDSKLGLLHAT